jgi:hypothetical protein
MPRGANSSYLHQGYDIIVPIAEPTYAVEEGIVKCVLTLGGGAYWRTAISKEQTGGFSKGWLYAHLIESTIQVDVGDTVHVHDYLGDIVQWSADWGHIHFVEIEDSGYVWKYDDNEWGIVYNPLLSLRPDTDLIAPTFEVVLPNSKFATSKFAFCVNETSVYLDPDSLYGDIDIIAKVVDYIGDSEWQQPAFEIYYWVKNRPEGNIVFPKTLGQRLNHAYDFYSSGNYSEWAPLIYKIDSLLVPISWMETERDFYHILTNNNGDTLLDLAEKDLAFATTDYPDGDYRIFIEAHDEYGNSTVDSADVKFKNNKAGIADPQNIIPLTFDLKQNYPNPFNPETHISYSIPNGGFVELKVYDVIGREIQTLVSKHQKAGIYSVTFNAGELASGIYIYSLKSGNFLKTKKLLLIH